jgi:hypothetical protein
VVLIICGGILFIRTEMSAVKRSLLDSQHIMEHNSLLETKNKELEAAKKQLLSDEEEFEIICCSLTGPAFVVTQMIRFLLVLFFLPLLGPFRLLSDDPFVLMGVSRHYRTQTHQDVREVAFRGLQGSGEQPRCHPGAQGAD